MQRNLKGVSGKPPACFLESERYKDAMLSLFTLFEALFQRSALEKAADLCVEVLDNKELLADRPQIRSAWEVLLAKAREEILELPQVKLFRQFFLRCWSVPIAWSRFEISAAEALPEIITEPQLTQAPAETAPESPDNRTGDPLTGDAYYAELERHERELFSAVAERCGYSIRATARSLDMSRNTVAAKMRKFGLIQNKGAMEGT
jgi:hypothetical protein